MINKNNISWEIYENSLFTTVFFFMNLQISLTTAKIDKLRMHHTDHGKCRILPDTG
jgi:hypothetical protein